MSPGPLTDAGCRAARPDRKHYYPSDRYGGASGVSQKCARGRLCHREGLGYARWHGPDGLTAFPALPYPGSSASRPFSHAHGFERGLPIAADIPGSTLSGWPSEPQPTGTSCSERFMAHRISVARTKEDRREQADVPAQQPQACQEPRVPCAHEHPCGPRHSGCAPPQGSRRPVGLTRGAAAAAAAALRR